VEDRCDVQYYTQHLLLCSSGDAAQPKLAKGKTTSEPTVFCFSFTLQRIRHPVERFRLPGRPPCSRDVSLLGFGFAVTLSLAAGAARRDAAHGCRHCGLPPGRVFEKKHA
jgi:hypothetical protein